MIKKILLPLLSVVFILGGIFSVAALVFLLMPRHDSRANLSLPTQIEDSVRVSDDADAYTDETDSEDVYIADVYQSLTLRSQPDSNSAPVMDEGLAPGTQMQMLNEVDGTSYAYVKILDGDFAEQTGYVNCEYITKLGEPTIRAEVEE